ncbi:MAG: flagellar hook protein FlgE [Gammaproteobacteria bacterium]|nr:flagellar hook protein FlgE [Gammaproteobacteria bacterium]
MPFRTALSGLNAASAELRVIGNNVANASTVGFKKSRAEFADIFATANLGAASNAIGSGVKISNIAQQFTQGNVGFTDNNLDLAISGQGFFRLSDGGVSVYSRAGAFSVDRNGLIVNSADQRLTGFLADSVGNITGAVGDIQIDTSDIAPQATTSVTPGLNIDAGAAIPAAPVVSSTFLLGGAQLDETAGTLTTPAFDLVDAYGNLVNNGTLQFTYVGGGATREWDVELLVGGAATAPPTIASAVDIGTDSVTLNWDADGGGAQNAIPITLNTTAITSVAGGTNDVTATTNGAVQGAFVASDATTYNHSTSLTIFDSQGASHLATLYYRKTAVPNQWETYLFNDGVQVNGAQANNADLLQFSTDGSLNAINGTLVPPSSITTPPIPTSGGAADINLTIDYTSLTQYGGGFNVNSLAQDGFSSGRLSGIDIDDTGVILARFTNGQSRTLAQIALANFSNTQGLSQMGNGNWAESFSSGPPLIGPPGASSLGLVQSGALEGSNVDLTEQLVNMITAQRNFQANAQVITTADTVTQTIINIR